MKGYRKQKVAAIKPDCRPCRRKSVRQVCRACSELQEVLTIN